jgi:hypothetical protein
LSSHLLSKNLEIKILKTVIFLVAFYECETSSLTLREENRFRGLRTVLRRKFGPKKEEGVKEWGRLHNEELHDMYASQNIIRVIK